LTGVGIDSMPDGAVVLLLYVSGNSPKSAEAARTIRSVCDQHLAGRYTLEVIDVLTEPSLSNRGGIVVTPTLLRISPEPARMVVGNLDNPSTVLYALDLTGGRSEDMHGEGPREDPEATGLP